MYDTSHTRSMNKLCAELECFSFDCLIQHRESPFKIVMDETKEDPNITSEAKQQERSTRHGVTSASKERKKNEKKKREEPKRVKREDSDMCLSGSMDLSYISSRGLDSFTDSLPRTCPSADWEEMSQDAAFSPIRLVPQDSYHEVRKELVTRGTQSDLSGNDLKVVGKGMFTSSPAINSKKKRPITKEEMLYGEGSLHVDPTGEKTEHDIMTMEETSTSESGVDQVQQALDILCVTLPEIDDLTSCVFGPDVISPPV